MKIDARMRWPAWIALLAIAAALFFSFTGDGDEVVRAIEPQSRLKTATRSDTVERVRFERLNERASAAVDTADLFVARSWRKPDAAPERASAPPLPFTYIGRLHSGGADTAFVAMGDRNLALRAGDLIQDTYRVERVAGSAVTFRHLPTGDQQTLVIGGSP